MNTPIPKRLRTQGSALITVLFWSFILLILTGVVLKYSSGEQQYNNRNRLILRARNMAENIALYASEQVTVKLYRVNNQSPRAFMAHVPGVPDANETYLPPASGTGSVLTTKYTNGTGMEVRAGIPVTGNPLAYIDPAVAANAGNPNVGLQASSTQVQIIAKATATHPILGTTVAYCEQDLEVAAIPLFQFAVFYNMDMEFGPGADMVISGPVHTNGNLIARMQSGKSNTLEFQDRVTTAKGFFANTGYKGPTVMNTGSVDNGPGGTGNLYFTAPSGTKTAIYGDSKWRDHFWGVSYTSPATASTIPPSSSLTAFADFAKNTYGNNLRTSVHGVTPLMLPAVSNYNEADNPATPEDDRNNGRQVIEIPETTDTAGMVQTKVARNAGLYILVNPTAQFRTGVLADATTRSLCPYSYRCFLSTINSDLSYTIKEVILPGQPTYGYNDNGTPGTTAALMADDYSWVNVLPNAYRVDTSVGSNQVLRIPKGVINELADTGYSHTFAPLYSGFDDAYFYDLRRATNSFPAIRSVGLPFTPRPINKIDLDMTRFKMMFDRTYSGNTTSTVYYPKLPSDGTTWGNFIFNPNGTPASYGLGLGTGYNLFGAAVALPAVQKAQNAVYAPGTINIGSTSQAGAAAAVPYGARFIVAETTSATIALADAGGTWVERYKSTADESSHAFTPTAGTTFIRVRQYLGGFAAVTADDGLTQATTKMVDELFVPIVADGTATLKASLSNDFILVPSNAAGAGALLGNANTEMRVFVGGTDVTADWSFTAVASTGGSAVTGRLGGAAADGTNSTGIGPRKNVYTVASMANNTGTVDITATNGANTQTITKRFTLKKQSYYTNAAAPTQTGRWLSVTSSLGPDPFQMYFAPTTAAEFANAMINPNAFAVAPADVYSTGLAKPWKDGISVYIHSSDAEDRSTSAGVLNRVDSAVRLWNGRGSTVSLPAATALTGFTLATNDAVYIIGHYNADGSINSTAGSALNPGGYSGVWPESSTEFLTSTMGDAITILSQPSFESTTTGGITNYRQSGGWSDALSAHVAGGSTASSTWQTSSPSSSNAVDGINTNKSAGNMPNLSLPSTATWVPTNNSNKFDPNTTEISTCLLLGIVPTNANPSALSSGTTPAPVTNGSPFNGANGQTSGGVHNYPRLCEVWGNADLYFRGSMVAMFESRVAMEPWGIRHYSAPGRYWGLNAKLKASAAQHHIPLEPMLLNARRMRYQELTAAQYKTIKNTIEALPH